MGTQNISKTWYVPAQCGTDSGQQSGYFPVRVEKSTTGP
jgi:hypothetical protein